MHLDDPEKDTKNATIYAESDSNFEYKQTIKNSHQVINTNYLQPLKAIYVYYLTAKAN